MMPGRYNARTGILAGGPVTLEVPFWDGSQSLVQPALGSVGCPSRVGHYWGVPKRALAFGLVVAATLPMCDPGTIVTVTNRCAGPIWVRIMGGSHSELKQLAPGESLESASFGRDALVGWSAEENRVGPTREVTGRPHLEVAGSDCP